MLKLAFVYYPVADLSAALRFYRDELGFEEAWREGEGTAGLVLPGASARLMLDVNVDDVEGRPGAVFQVDSVDAFYRTHQGHYAWPQMPVDVPGRRWAIFEDPTGNLVRLIDESRE